MGIVTGYALSAFPGSFRFFPELLPDSPSRLVKLVLGTSSQD